MTHADDPTSDLKVEFGFDVLQVAHGRYAPDAYRDLIGFQVAKPVLERSFLKTFVRKAVHGDPLLPQAILAFYDGFVPAKAGLAAQLERFKQLHAPWRG